METQTSKQASSKPVIATVYKPPGGKTKPGKYPDGFQEEDFVLGKPLPKPDIKKYGGQDLGGRTIPDYPIAKPKPGSYKRDYGKAGLDLKEVQDFLEKWYKNKRKKEAYIMIPVEIAQ